MSKKLSRSLVLTLIVVFIVSVVPSAVSAQATSTTGTLIGQIQTLLQQVKTLQDQLAELQKQQGEIRGQLQETLQLTRSLSQGLSGDEVTLLQEILATDPDIYPEGLVTGYFGPLTEKAVKKFQAKFGIEQVGIVGPQTRSQINKLLTEGAGNSGKVPPGLLIAPGIAKKLGSTPTPPSNQWLPPGIAKKFNLPTNDGDSNDSDTDTVAPVISSLGVSSTTATTTMISWTTNEVATGKVWYNNSSPVNTTGNPNSADTTLQINHNFSLSDLTASTTYYYIVLSADDTGNVATSSEKSFQTLSE